MLSNQIFPGWRIEKYQYQNQQQKESGQYPEKDSQYLTHGCCLHEKIIPRLPGLRPKAYEWGLQVIGSAVYRVVVIVFLCKHTHCLH